MEVDPQVKKLGARVRTIRMSKGISREKLSDMSGVSEPAIMNFEHGTVMPKLETICKISSALGYRLTFEMK